MKAINFFIKNTNYKKQEIKNVQFIKSGFSDNKNYLITLKNNKKFQVRLPNAVIDHTNEILISKIYSQIQIIYLDKKGNMIKEWINGRIKDFSHEYDLIKALNVIKQFQKITLPNNIDDFGLYHYKKYYKYLSVKLMQEFLTNVKCLKKEKTSLIHGDINKLNIIISKNKAYLIDFEWVRKGPSIYDYASLLAFSSANISIVSKFTGYSIKRLYKYKRLVLIHTILWSYSVQTDKSKKLLQQCEYILKSNA